MTQRRPSTAAGIVGCPPLATRRLVLPCLLDGRWDGPNLARGANDADAIVTALPHWEHDGEASPLQVVGGMIRPRRLVQSDC